MDYIKEILRRELRSVTSDIERVDENIKHLNDALETAEKRKVELTDAKQQVLLSLGAGTLKPLDDGNACDICGGHLEVVATFSLPGKATTLKDERCPCCG